MVATFNYSARDPLGSIHAGSVVAGTVDEAVQQLRRDGFQVVKIDAEAGVPDFLSARISKNDIIYVTSQLAIMVETGITIATALETITDQEPNAKLKRLLTDVQQAVEAGEDFSAALARYPKYFDETYVSLIRASEATGTLGEMLDRIAAYLQKEKETRGKVRSALAYPVAMLSLSLGITIFLLVYILPKFEPLFTRPGAKLPASTKFLMTLSESLLGYWYLWIFGCVAVVVSFVLFKRTDTGHNMLDYAKLNIPVVGSLFRKVAITRSIRTLGTMLSSGVSVLDALQLSSEVAGNVYYRRMWEGVIEQVATGKRICESLDGNQLMPPMLIRMISSGEDSGKLDKILQRVSAYYDTEVENAIKTTTALIEPIMITFMGVVIGGIAMSLLLPIFSLSKPGG